METVGAFTLPQALESRFWLHPPLTVISVTTFNNLFQSLKASNELEEFGSQSSILEVWVSCAAFSLLWS